MIYYGVITVCAAMFSMQFFFTQMYQKAYGKGLMPMLVSSAGSGIVGIIMLSLINGFHFGCTPFSLIMAILVGLNSMAFSFCSLEALGKINLSLYSVFSMLGGMALPFVAGIAFFGEALTLGKCICFIFIVLALMLTVEKGEKGSGAMFYIGVFVLNGMSGVLSKIFQALPFSKVSSVEYSFLCAFISTVMALVLIPFVKGEKKPLNKMTVIAICGKGVLNRLANLLLLICLTYLPASAQYPFITGGTMIFSTIICYFTNDKPSRRELISVALSFIGLLALVFVA